MKKSLVLIAVLIGSYMAQAQTGLATAALPLTVKASATRLVYKDFTLYRYATDGIAYKAYYNNRGRWLHTILSYKENNLPASIRDRIINVYDEYEIAWVDEVRTPNLGNVYRVQLKGLRKMLIVDVTEQDMQLVAEYTL